MNVQSEKKDVARFVLHTCNSDVKAWLLTNDNSARARIRARAHYLLTRSLVYIMDIGLLATYIINVLVWYCTSLRIGGD